MVGAEDAGVHLQRVGEEQVLQVTVGEVTRRVLRLAACMARSGWPLLQRHSRTWRRSDGVGPCILHLAHS